MAYFRECPHCDACLDPGEKCECIKEYKSKKQKTLAATLIADELLEQAEWQQEKLAFCS